MNKENIILYIILGLVIFLLLFQLTQLLKPKAKIEKTYFNLTSNNISDDSTGFYYHPHYFCVITKNRTNAEIMETTIHELAHLLILTDEKHFLERYKGD